MLWLDGFLAGPVIGLRIEHNFSAAFKWAEKLIPALSNKHDVREIEFSKDNPFTFKVDFKDGFFYKQNIDQVVIDYRHLLEEESMPGAAPTFKPANLSNYSTLLENSLNYFGSVLEELDKVEPLQMNRMGVVARLNLSQEDLPPGIEMFIDHIKKPWSADLMSMNSMINIILNETEEYKDCCRHSIRLNENTKKDETSISLDWQRLYESPVVIRPSSTIKTAKECCENAVKYFESFGKGELEYD